MIPSRRTICSCIQPYSRLQNPQQVHAKRVMFKLMTRSNLILFNMTGSHKVINSSTKWGKCFSIIIINMWHNKHVDWHYIMTFVQTRQRLTERRLLRVACILMSGHFSRSCKKVIIATVTRSLPSCVQPLRVRCIRET